MKGLNRARGYHGGCSPERFLLPLERGM